MTLQYIDFFSCFFSRTLTDGDDVLSKDFLFGNINLSGGNDLLSIAKFALFSTINGGDGNDTFELKGSALGVTFNGGAGDDRFRLDSPDFTGSVKFNGGTGLDTFELYSAQKLSFTVNKDGSVTYDFYNDWGWKQASVQTVDVERYVIRGSEFNDKLIGGSGNDFLDGGKGADTYYETAGDDWYVFDNAGDKIISTATAGGNDTIAAFVDVDLRTQGADIENLRLYIADGAGDINATGNNLSNLITGNGGNNVISGLGGNDKLYGKGGADVFAFHEFGLANRDYIIDFDSDDAIQLDKNVFTGLVADSGHLAASSFVIGSAATSSAATVIYNKATGVISYDADGNGSGAAQDIAIVAKNLSFFDHNDILLA